MATEPIKLPEQPRTRLRSRLGRLFLYSKDTAFIAQENFTTEALAQAIEQDPAPMLNALRRAAGLRGTPPACPFDLGDVARLLPYTQQYIPGKGFLDLVLEAVGRDGWPLGRVWVEVKIDAPESGEQLSAYAEAASVQPQTWLITLGRTAIRESVPHLPWIELYRAARMKRPQHPAWVDLLEFLEEQAVATDGLSPVSDREAGGLEPAYALLQKASATLVAVHKALDTTFPPAVAANMRWRAEGELLNSAAATFRQRGEFVATSGPLTYGLRSDDGTAYWAIAIRPTRPGPDVAKSMREAADVAGLDEWERPPAGGEVLVAQVRATTLPSHEQAVAWFCARLLELRDSGLVSLALGLESRPTTFRAQSDARTSGAT